MIAVEEDKESEKEEEPVLEQEGSNDGEEVLQLPGGTGAGESRGKMYLATTGDPSHPYV